jgi:hypothetical protein
MVSLLQIIENIVSYLDGFYSLVSGICFLIGFVMTITALKQAQRRQEMGAHSGSWNSPIATFIFAGFFLGFPALIDILNYSVFNETAQSASKIFEYADSTVGRISQDSARTMITGIVRIVQFMGLIAVGRGLYLMNQSAQGTQGPKTFGPGLTFILSGICATNFPRFVQIMEAIVT